LKKQGATVKSNDTKLCTSCKTQKPATIENFRRRSDTGTLRGPCRQCLRDRDAEKRKDTPRAIREREHVQLLAEGKQRCTKCLDIKPATQEFFAPKKRSCKVCRNEESRQCVARLRQDPEWVQEYNRKKREEYTRRMQEDPAFVARKRASGRKTYAKYAEDPEWRKRRSIQSWEYEQEYLKDPEKGPKILARKRAWMSKKMQDPEYRKKVRAREVQRKRERILTEEGYREKVNKEHREYIARKKEDPKYREESNRKHREYQRSKRAFEMWCGAMQLLIEVQQQLDKQKGE
jgi:hypothetical protein